MASDYFNALRAGLRSGGDLATQASANRALRDADMRTPLNARNEALAKRAAYDATCK